eukprot:TRINITY_DN42671_c0_g1_i1.p1 TRINITY_DN42671_c0_g1~~TRINITY_DN42671_c0_g1_i1.p1  ORF type:complete len:250 (+),score=67.84 TRINITY_DN42671_c0_g1_i1:75-752(+)
MPAAQVALEDPVISGHITAYIPHAGLLGVAAVCTGLAEAVSRELIRVGSPGGCLDGLRSWAQDGLDLLAQCWAEMEQLERALPPLGVLGDDMQLRMQGLLPRFQVMKGPCRVMVLTLSAITNLVAGARTAAAALHVVAASARHRRDPTRCTRAALVRAKTYQSEVLELALQEQRADRDRLQAQADRGERDVARYEELLAHVELGTQFIEDILVELELEEEVGTLL